MSYSDQNNDLAYIRIKPLDKSVSYKTISLTADRGLIAPGTNVELLGWGYTEIGLPDVLYEGVNVIDSNTNFKNNRITHQLTLFNLAAPQTGDSGGPLLTYKNGRWYAVGLAYEIDQAKLPLSYYTNLVELYPWINLVTKVKENQGSFIGKPPDW